MFVRGAVLLLASLWFAPLTAAEIRPFISGSYGEIVDARGDSRFLLAFWSIDCPPCYAELEMLGKRMAKRPFDLILVSTDSPGAEAEVGRVLANFGLTDAENWIFAAPDQRLRFEVDRTWYGELPRSYLFGPQGRETVTGTLEVETLLRWLK
ncbi:MAG TPA: hypothetical protein VIQ22_01210 [Gammaproteobacteria bacterium]